MKSCYLLFIREGKNIRLSHKNQVEKERRQQVMGLIPCTMDCIYEHEGECALDRAVSAGTDRGELCAYYIRRTEQRPVISPNKWSQDAESETPSCYCCDPAESHPPVSSRQPQRSPAQKKSGRHAASADHFPDRRPRTGGVC